MRVLAGPLTLTALARPQAAQRLVADAVHLAQSSPGAEADNTTAVVLVLSDPRAERPTC
jgi:ABC-type enterobactin transport system permease subunit